MARIVIWEPRAELRDLFEATVAQMGHEPTLSGELRDWSPAADAFLVDVDEEGAAEAVARAMADAPGLPLIACSIYPRGERPMGLEPVAHLVKPFSRPELERAIAEAVRA
jgi:hypothetical protein